MEKKPLKRLPKCVSQRLVELKAELKKTSVYPKMGPELYYMSVYTRIGASYFIKSAKTLLRIALLYRLLAKRSNDKLRDFLLNLINAECLAVVASKILNNIPESQDRHVLEEQILAFMNKIEADYVARVRCQARPELRKFSAEIAEEIQKLRLKKRVYLNEEGKFDVDKAKTIMKTCSADFKEIFAKISQHCLEVLGSPPCKFSHGGMGSGARQDFTPYSDFENMILMEDGKHSDDVYDYFRAYAGLYQLIIINVGETPLRNLAITELNDLSEGKGSPDDWYWDQDVKPGIRFDSSHPFASKHPLGRSWTHEKRFDMELIKPVTEMAKLLLDEKNPKDKINGYHLSDVLLHTYHVAGEEAVHERFAKLRAKLIAKDGETFKKLGFTMSVEKSEEGNLNELKVIATEWFHKAVVSRIPDNVEELSSGTVDPSVANIGASLASYLGFGSGRGSKDMLHRFVCLLVTSLGRYNKIHGQTLFDFLTQLRDRGIITENAKRNLEYLICSIYAWRDITYSRTGGQEDKSLGFFHTLLLGDIKQSVDFRSMVSILLGCTVALKEWLNGSKEDLNMVIAESDFFVDDDDFVTILATNLGLPFEVKHKGVVMFASVAYLYLTNLIGVLIEYSLKCTFNYMPANASPFDRLVCQHIQQISRPLFPSHSQPIESHNSESSLVFNQLLGTSGNARPTLLSIQMPNAVQSCKASSTELQFPHQVVEINHSQVTLASQMDYIRKQPGVSKMSHIKKCSEALLDVLDYDKLDAVIAVVTRDTPENENPTNVIAREIQKQMNGSVCPPQMMERQKNLFVQIGLYIRLVLKRFFIAMKNNMEDGREISLRNLCETFLRETRRSQSELERELAAVGGENPFAIVGSDVSRMEEIFDVGEFAIVEYGNEYDDVNFRAIYKIALDGCKFVFDDSDRSFMDSFYRSQIGVIIKMFHSMINIKKTKSQKMPSNTASQDTSQECNKP